MVVCRDGTINDDGVFTSANNFSGFAASAPVFIGSLSRGTVVVITLTGKSSYFSVAIASTSALNSGVHYYNTNHHAEFHYSSWYGRVNSDADNDWTYGTFARHNVYQGYNPGATFIAVLTLRGADHSVSFSVNGAPQDGVWPLPTTESFYLMLATSGGTIAVTDVSITMADSA